MQYIQNLVTCTAQSELLGSQSSNDIIASAGLPGVRMDSDWSRGLPPYQFDQLI